MTRHHSCRVSPFGHPRINARLTTPRGISQPPTSFIGSQCQGIHHAPLNTYNTKNHYREKITPQQTRYRKNCIASDARNHYPQIKHHTPPPSRATTTTTPEGMANPPPTQGTGGRRACCLRTQQCVWQHHIHPPQRKAPRCSQVLSVVHQNHAHYKHSPSNESVWDTGQSALCGPAQTSWCSLERR